MTTSIAFVGDLMFTHRVREAQQEHEDMLYPLRPVLDALAEPDLLVGNFETTVSQGRAPVAGARPDYWALPESVTACRDAGFSLMTLATNHIYDFDADGVAETLACMRRVGMPFCGLEGSGLADGESWVGRLRGPDGQSFTILPYCGMRNVAVSSRPFFTRIPTPARIERDVREWATRSDHVIVVVHAGWHDVPSPDVEVQARAAVAAGASLVVCHHSHELSGIERVGDALILWGLGNFVAATNNFGERRREGMLVTCRFDQNGVADHSVLQTWVDDEYRTTPAPPERADAIRARIDELSAIISAGGSRARFEAATTAESVWLGVAETAREAFRGGGGNLIPTLIAIRPRHAYMILLGVRNGARKALSGVVSRLRGKSP